MRRTLEVILALLLSCLVMELVTRRVYSYRLTYDQGLRRDIIVPGSKVYYRLEGGGVSVWATNGLRRGSSYSPGTMPSVLVLGDSFTEAMQVDDKECFTVVAERLLSERGHPIAVLNAGIAGSSVADYAGSTEQDRARFRPFWVVVQVTEDDFLLDAWKPSKTHFAMDAAKGTLRVVPVETKPPLGERSLLARCSYQLGNISSLYRFAYLRTDELRRWVRNEPPLFRGAAPKDRETQTVVNPENEYHVREEFWSLVEAFGGRLTLLLLPKFRPGQKMALSPVEQLLVRLSSEEGVGCIIPDWTGIGYETTGRAPYGFNNGRFNAGHLNPAGHNIVAHALAAEIERRCQENGLF